MTTLKKMIIRLTVLETGRAFDDAAQSTTSFGMVIEYANVSKVEESDQNLECLSIGAC
jgi:hypothetical protein